MNKPSLAALCLFGLLTLPGCVGRSGPSAIYLQVGRPAATQAASQGETRGKLAVAVGRIGAVEALDRQAVMLAKGRVMIPSQHWYWEDTPGRLFERSLADSLNRTSGLTAVWPLRWTSHPRLTLSGTVTAFALDEGAHRLSVTLECQLKAGEDGREQDTRTFEASVPVSTVEPQALAEAGAKALATVSDEAAAWVERTAKAMPREGAR